jgi:UDP-hydrolysing UDP-N-acetyl-D-glucosamine 2-epimerase
MREIGVLTTSRADFGIYEPLIDAMSRSRRLSPRLIVSGSHLESRYGRTVREIEKAGYTAFRSFPCHRGDMTSSMAMMMAGMSRVLRRWRPGILLVLGDRFEMLAGALAAVPFHIIIGHIHGGEITRGALDDSFRHALSKISHFHFPATREAATRLKRMGEEPWRITVSGALSLDRIRKGRPYDLQLPESFLLVTYHPVTREPGREVSQIDTLIKALRILGLPCVVTAPNADPGNEIIRQRLRRFCASDGRSRFVESAGADAYFGMMERAEAMVGNSSSGILEAPSFRLPVVNIGLRQEGRLRARNVIDCGTSVGEIVSAVQKAVSATFRRSLRGLVNPYGDGRAAERIVRRLETVSLDDRLRIKRFFE